MRLVAPFSPCVIELSPRPASVIALFKFLYNYSVSLAFHIARHFDFYFSQLHMRIDGFWRRLLVVFCHENEQKPDSANIDRYCHIELVTQL